MTSKENTTTPAPEKKKPVKKQANKPEGMFKYGVDPQEIKDVKHR